MINVMNGSKHTMRKAILRGQASPLTKPPGSQLIICPIFSLLRDDFVFSASPQKEHKETKCSKKPDAEIDVVCSVLLKINIVLTEGAELNTFIKNMQSPNLYKDPSK